VLENMPATDGSPHRSTSAPENGRDAITGRPGILSSARVESDSSIPARCRVDPENHPCRTRSRRSASTQMVRLNQTLGEAGPVSAKRRRVGQRVVISEAVLDAVRLEGSIETSANERKTADISRVASLGLAADVPEGGSSPAHLQSRERAGNGWRRDGTTSWFRGG